MSGAPKIKAIELIYELEKQRRGIYAGAVGRFDFADDEMDTCIAIRTMTFKDGIAYLQAGGGIVFDSVEEDEYIDFSNGPLLTAIASLIFVIVLAANLYVIIILALGRA